MKTKTLEQVEAMHRKAVRFVEDVLEDSSLAEELEDLSPEEYAERKRIHIENPHNKRIQVFVINNQTHKGRKNMALPTRAELQERIDELEEQNAEQQEKLDAIAGLATDDSDDDESDDDESDDEEMDDED